MKVNDLDSEIMSLKSENETLSKELLQTKSILNSLTKLYDLEKNRNNELVVKYYKLLDNREVSENERIKFVNEIDSLKEQIESIAFDTKKMHKMAKKNMEFRRQTSKIVNDLKLEIENLKSNKFEKEFLSMNSYCQDLTEKIKELESAKHTIGEELLRKDIKTESTLVCDDTQNVAFVNYYVKDYELTKGVFEKHGKEIESLISTLERCKSERKRFEYKLKFSDLDFQFSIKYFEKEVINNTFNLENTHHAIEKITTLFLSERINEELLDLMFEKTKPEYDETIKTWKTRCNYETYYIWLLTDGSIQLRVKAYRYNCTNFYEFEKILLDNKIYL